MAVRPKAAVPLYIVALAVMWLGCVALGLQAQPLPPSLDKVQFPNVNRDLAGQLAAISTLVADKQYYEALDRLQTILRDHGDELVPVDAAREPLASTQRFVQARWLVHHAIGLLPPAALKIFRQRTDGIAAKWLDQGGKNRDVRILQRVADEAFCSTPAEQALELLGDLAFERGDFTAAQHWWRLLALPASSEVATHDILYPNPHPDIVARVRAKQIVTLLFQQSAARIPAELKAYRKTHGTTAGKLAGKSGPYANIIEDMARQGQGSQPAAEQEWPTFAGGPGRQGTLSVAISQQLWAGGPAWRVRLATGELLPDSVATKVAAGKFALQTPIAHPIVFQGRVFVADERFVRGFDLRSGRLVLQFDLLDIHKKAMTDSVPPNKLPGGLRFSLSAADGHIFARLGAAWFGPTKDGDKRPDESWLVCLRLPESGSPKTSLQQHAWSVSAGTVDEPWSFEGAPLVYEQSVYIAKSRAIGQRTRTVICCFNAATGALRWEQEVCEMPEFDDRHPGRSRHHLLTLAGGRIVYCSHAGAVVGIDPSSGKIAWAVRYPSRGPRMKDGQPAPRDLCPPVAFDHCVLAAPADAARLYCFDALTGRNVWEREPIEVVHLLGVSGDCVIMTTPTGIRAINARTGDDDGGWRQPSAGGLAGQGRGLIAGGWVFWPAQDSKSPLRALSVLAGTPTRGTEAYDPGQLIHLSPGNMAYGHGCLVIVTAEELMGYVPPLVPLPKPQT